MSCYRSLPLQARAALALCLGAALSLACSDEGQALPERCVEPALPIFDFKAELPPADDNLQYPCVTPVGHAVASNGVGGTSTAAGGAPTTGLAGDAGAGASL